MSKRKQLGDLLINVDIAIRKLEPTDTFHKRLATQIENRMSETMAQRLTQFDIATDGTIYELVSLGTMYRHTVGLNYTAIGIEHVGESDQQILDDLRQLHARCG